MTNNRPAAVESAAATPPAATSAMTQPGRPAISGLASTIISRSIYTSLIDSVGWLFNNRSPWAPVFPLNDGLVGERAAPEPYCMMPSLFLSCQAISPVFSQFPNHSGASAYGVLCTVSTKFNRAKDATAGAVVYKIAMKTKA